MANSEEPKEKRTKEIIKLLSRMSVRKSVRELAGLIGVEKVLGDQADVDMLDIILDVPDIADVDESDRLT